MENTVKKRRVPAPVIAIIVALVVVGLVAAAYCGLCDWVRDNGRLLPGTTAKDATGAVSVDLSEMLRDDAVALMTRLMDDNLAQRVVTIRYDGGSKRLDGTLLKVDPVSPIDYGMAYKAYQPFLRLGALWMGWLEDPVALSLSAAILTPEGAEAADRMAAEIADEVYVAPVGYTCAPDETAENMVVTHGTVGRRLDSAALAETLKQALLNGAADLEAEYITIPTDSIDAYMIYDMVYTPAVDPYLLEDGTLSLPQDGYTIDVEAARETLNSVGPGETCAIPILTIKPDFSTCQHLLYKDTLSENVSTLDGVHERSFNVNRTAEFCNETVILPGQVFSYLGTIGDPAVKNGYMMSTGYQNGETVEMEGGGACQVSSALYYCAVYANLEIVWRANHAFSVTYVPKGLDATVYYPSLDFQFRNNTPWPIKIQSYTDGTDNGNVYVKILGTKQDGTYVVPEINLISTTPWNVKYEPDETIGVGTTKIKTTPYTGYKVEVYRCVYDANGSLISRTFENTSRYSKRDRVVLFNPADAERWGINPDGTPLAIRTLTVNWVDTEGNPLSEQLVKTGMNTGVAYSTEQKEFEGYTFLKTTGAAVSGVMTADRTVTYVYEKIPEPVVEPEVAEEPLPDVGGEPVPEV